MSFILSSTDPESGDASWIEDEGGLSPGQIASLEANWPTSPDELHLWAPAWSVSTTFFAPDTFYALDLPGLAVANSTGRWVFAIGATGGGEQGYVAVFHAESTLFGSAAFTPSAARITFISTLTSQDASPVGGTVTLRLYTTDGSGARVLAATFQNPVAFTIPVTGATPASQTIPLSGGATAISGRVFMTLAVVMGTDDVMSNSVEFLLDGIHLTFT